MIGRAVTDRQLLHERELEVISWFTKVTVLTCDAFIKGRATGKDWLEMASTQGALKSRHLSEVGVTVAKCFGTHPELFSAFCSMLGVCFQSMKVPREPNTP